MATGAEETGVQPCTDVYNTRVSWCAYGAAGHVNVCVEYVECRCAFKFEVMRLTV